MAFHDFVAAVGVEHILVVPSTEAPTGPDQAKLRAFVSVLVAPRFFADEGVTADVWRCAEKGIDLNLKVHTLANMCKQSMGNDQEHVDITPEMALMVESSEGQAASKVEVLKLVDLLACCHSIAATIAAISDRLITPDGVSASVVRDFAMKPEAMQVVIILDKAIAALKASLDEIGVVVTVQPHWRLDTVSTWASSVREFRTVFVKACFEKVVFGLQGLEANVCSCLLGRAQ